MMSEPRKCWECGVAETGAVMHPTALDDQWLCGPCWQSEKQMYKQDAEDLLGGKA